MLNRTMVAVAGVALVAGMSHASNFTGGWAASNWSTSTSVTGTASVTQQDSSSIDLNYNMTTSWWGVQALGTGSLVSPITGTVSFDINWTASGIPPKAWVLLQVFADGPGGRTTQTIANPYYSFWSGSFNGSATLNVVAGQTFGVMAGGWATDDQSWNFSGDVHLSNLVVAPAPGAIAMAGAGVLTALRRKRR